MSVDPLAGATQANGLATAAATCAACGAPLVADQHYCLACGQPASPVRLAFLDVLQSEYRAPAAGGTPLGPPTQVYAAYPGAPEPDGLLGALRRYSGLLALIGVLLASLLIGLLVGHWATGGGGGAGKQVVEVKIPGGLQAVAPAVAGSSVAGASGTGQGSSGAAKASGASSSHAGAKSAKSESAAEEAQAEKEVKAATAPPPVKKKASSGALQKLEHSTGKKHEQEVSKLIHGDEPVETH